MLNIALIAQDKKKELMVQFCMAYCGILSKHRVCATTTTAKLVSDATGLRIEKLLPGNQGGEQQISARVSYNEIDLVLYFRDPMYLPKYETDIHSIVRLCDLHNIPIATNVATAEMLVLGMDRGDLDWRKIAHPKL
ncbi:MAG: methylglyoxal synthase [Clostridia bacterium]